MEAHDRNHTPRVKQRGKWALIGFLAVAAFFLWTEHRVHVLATLPYLLLLACPLMHLLHRGHGGHGHHHGRRDRAGISGADRTRAGEKS